MLLEGHTDEVGSDEYNLALGKNRAIAAVNHLYNNGVKGEQLAITSLGEQAPLLGDLSDNSYANNRRVEIKTIE